MVQPVASPSCFSCTASYSPCELIYDVIRRVSTCVRSIFSAIAIFITSWCSWVETPPAPVAAPIAAPSPAAPMLAVDPRNQELAGACHFLQARMDSFRNTFPGFDFRTVMSDSDGARTFLTRLMIWDLAKDTTTIPLPLPPFIAGAIDVARIADLRAAFNTLSGADYSFVRYDFVTGVPVNSPTWAYSNPAMAEGFMQQADSLVEDFLNENEMFGEIAESARTMFLRNT
jgi:hypothetical protein